ncbi:MAG TPA: MarC family protein [Candidatus Binataceae bacterium]|nr:MarC family protein [Candidatus Binataceae bacterium]
MHLTVVSETWTAGTAAGERIRRDQEEALMEHWRQYSETLVALFVIADPVGAVPIFLTLTQHQSPADRKHLADVTALAVAIILAASVFVAEPFLRFFGVDVAAFRVAGGILIMLMALGMLEAAPRRTQRTPEEMAEAERKTEIAVVPLAIPLIAGPGAISTVIIYAHQSATWFDTIYLVGACVLVAISVWLALRAADPIRDVLGATGINVVTRLLGVILTAVAVEFITSGLSRRLSGLAVVDR